MRGHLYYRAGAWRLVVNAKDPVTGRRKPVHRTVRAPDNQRGRRQAESELAKLVAEVEAGQAAPTSGLTIDAMLARYVADRSPGWSPGQVDAVRARIAHHILPHIGGTDAAKFRPADVAAWHATLRAKRKADGKPLAESTIARLHSILHAAYEWAVALELVARNPCAKRLPRRRPVDVDPPEPGDVARLLAEADDLLALFLRVAALTGARRGQVCALQWHDIDDDPPAIRWRRALVKVPGGVAVRDTTKSGRRYVTAIDARTLDMLRRQRRRAVEAALAAGAHLADDAYVFARDPAGREPWHPDGATQRFAALRGRLGLKGMRLHDLRHYMATQLLAEGGDVQTLSGRGGWADPTTPLRVYSHFQPARDAEIARRMAERLDADTG